MQRNRAFEQLALRGLGQRQLRKQSAGFDQIVHVDQQVDVRQRIDAERHRRDQLPQRRKDVELPRQKWQRFVHHRVDSVNQDGREIERRQPRDQPQQRLRARIVDRGRGRKLRHQLCSVLNAIVSAIVVQFAHCPLVSVVSVGDVSVTP